MKAGVYDRHATSRVEVTLNFTPTNLSVDYGDRSEEYPIETLNFSNRLGNIPRLIYLPDGKVCETADNDAVDAFLQSRKQDGASRLLHYLESRMRFVAGALLATIGFGYLFVTYGLPSTARYVAEKMPEPMVYSLGTGTLDTLDKILLRPTELPLSRQNALRDTCYGYIDRTQSWPRVKLLFRSGSIGPNALALPDGTVVMTDDLVKLAKDDRELLGIFFHELGHIERRHALRTVLQDSAVYLLVSAVTGDATTASSILAALPTALVESSYSREMETEADTYAYDAMQQYAIAHEYYAAILERIIDTQPKQTKNRAFAYLDSHPETRERIERFRTPQ